MNSENLISFAEGHAEIVRDIVYRFKGEVVSDVTANGQTALHISAARGDNQSLRYLTPYKKLIDTSDSYGNACFIDFRRSTYSVYFM